MGRTAGRPQHLMVDGTVYRKVGRMQTILYIDDRADSLDVVRALLATQSREVIAAGAGQDGLALATEHEADLILLDLHLPDVAGPIVLRRLKEDVATRAIPVIVVAAQNIEDMLEPERGLIAAFVMKPIDPSGFVRLVDRLLAGSSEPVASSRRSWRCTDCFSEWLRPRDKPPGQDARCIRCDGPLALIEASAKS
jgi:two-component system, cell cycle response regulator DivK